MGGLVHHLLARLTIGDTYLPQLQANTLTVRIGVHRPCRNNFLFFACQLRSFRSGLTPSMRFGPPLLSEEQRRLELQREINAHPNHLANPGHAIPPEPDLDSVKDVMKERLLVHRLGQRHATISEAEINRIIDLKGKILDRMSQLDFHPFWDQHRNETHSFVITCGLLGEGNSRFPFWRPSYNICLVRMPRALKYIRLFTYLVLALRIMGHEIRISSNPIQISFHHSLLPVRIHVPPSFSPKSVKRHSSLSWPLKVSHLSSPLFEY